MYDVTVIGAGPSGSYLSLSLSKKGFKVLLIEKRSLPRDKPCAGCLSSRIKRILPEFPKLKDVHGISVKIPRFGERYFYFKDPIAFFVERSSFDKDLVDRARGEGTDLKEREVFLGFEKRDDFYLVKTDKSTYRSRYLVLANGARPCGKATGLAVVVNGCTSLDVPWDVRIELMLDKGGYAWLFNKGESFSMGVGFFHKKDFSKLLPTLREFAGSFGIQVKAWRFHPLPYYSPEKIPFYGEVPTVGDRGFFMDAFLGEGIYYGLLSSTALAESFSDGNGPGGYLERVKPILEELKAAFYVSKCLRSFPRISNWLFWNSRKPYIFFSRLLRGERSYKDSLKALMGRV